MLYNLIDAQSIQVALNTRTSSSAPASPLALSPTSTIEALTHVLEVDYLMKVSTTLMVGELTFPSVSTKRAREMEQQSPRIECSPIQTHVALDDTSGEVNHFLKISNIFSSQLPHTLEEDVVIVPMSNLSFV